MTEPADSPSPAAQAAYVRRIDRLRADMFEQGRRVSSMLEQAVEAVFDGDADRCQRVIESDEVIDRVDVEIERAAVSILHDVAREVAAIDDEQLRGLLMIVKVNNEIERIADAAVDIAAMRESIETTGLKIPGTFRVMANSVIGMLHTAIRSFRASDTALARAVLTSDDTIDEFEHAILRETQRSLAQGEIDVDAAFALHAMAARLEIINEHCCNIAQQVIYIATGAIVRHEGGNWSEPRQPG